MNNGKTKIEPKGKKKNLRIHPSCKCSKCGKSQEDGVEIYNYYPIGEGIFCTQCRNPNEK